jgi:hypothetical protein
VARTIGAQLANAGRPVVILFDELPDLCEAMLKRNGNADAVNGFLAGLGHWRSHGNVAMLFTGSVGLRGLATQGRIDVNHFSDTIVLDLPPFERPEAMAFLAALIAGSGSSGWTSAMMEHALDGVAAFYPGVLQYAFMSLHNARVTTAEDIDRVFQEVIRPGLDRDFFAQFTRRMQRYDKPLRRRLDRAIAAVAASTDWVPLASFVQALAARDGVRTSRKSSTSCARTGS